ncbi:MAG TPA: drug:proton antiporter, partial [Acidimicrobiaceae bacterium]|nr:drug:proton antiporter [Acidimicrobiaceae bacterium]
GRTSSYVLFDPSELDPSPNGERILVTQNDVRAIQLAKAALYAGIRLLQDHLETDQLDQISLAGAFGSHVDTIRATVLGLVPDCDPDRVNSIGNAAGAGATIALLSGAARRSIAEVVRTIEKVETALEPSFQAHFVDAMAIPHRSAEYPQLSNQFSLPDRPATSISGPGRRRRRSKAK